MAFVECGELRLRPRQSCADRVKAKLHSFRNLLVTQAAVAQQQKLRLLDLQLRQHLAHFDDPFSAQQEGERVLCATFALSEGIAFQFFFHAMPPVGAKSIDRGASRGPIEPATDQPTGCNAGTAAVEPQEYFGANLFGLGVALQHSPGDADDALLVLPKDRFELRFYPAIAHARCFYTSTTTDGVNL